MSQTREERIWRTYKAAWHSDWVRNGRGPSPIMWVAMRFKMPIVQARGIINEYKARRREAS